MADVVNQRTVHVSCNSAVQYGRNVSEMDTTGLPKSKLRHKPNRLSCRLVGGNLSFVTLNPLIFDNLRKNSVQAQGNCTSIVVVVSPLVSS